MSNPIRKLIKDIQYKTDLTLDEIADKLGYSQSYFRNEVSKGKSKSVLETIETKFKEIIEQNVPRETYLHEPEVQYKANGAIKPSYTDKYISLLEDQLKTAQERLQAQERLDKLLAELQKNRALLTAALEHIAKLRASAEKKPLEKIQTEMGNSYFSALGLDGKTI